MYELAKQQLAELDAHESELRGQLETLWRTVREELRKYEKERDEGEFLLPNIVDLATKSY